MGEEAPRENERINDPGGMKKPGECDVKKKVLWDDLGEWEFEHVYCHVGVESPVHV